MRVEHHVKARAVNFVNGSTGAVAFELIEPPAAHGYIAIRDVTLHWEYRLGPHHAWHRFDTTRHRLYAVLGVSTAPWHQTPLNTQLPWTDVLNYACRWAEGAASADMAAALVTQAVYALGPSIVTYDCPGGGSSHYSFPNFDGTHFVERLRGGIGNTEGRRHPARALLLAIERSGDYDAAIGRRGSVSVDRWLGQGKRDR